MAGGVRRTGMGHPVDTRGPVSEPGNAAVITELGKLKSDNSTAKERFTDFWAHHSPNNSMG